CASAGRNRRASPGERQDQQFASWFFRPRVQRQVHQEYHAGRLPARENHSRQQVRLEQPWTLLLQQFREDLLVSLSLIDQTGQLLAHGRGLTAAVRVAAGQRVEVAGADVAAHHARAIDTRQEPLDPLVLAGTAAEVRRQLRRLHRGGRRRHLQTSAL